MTKEKARQAELYRIVGWISVEDEWRAGVFDCGELGYLHLCWDTNAEMWNYNWYNEISKTPWDAPCIVCLTA